MRDGVIQKKKKRAGSSGKSDGTVQKQQPS